MLMIFGVANASSWRVCSKPEAGAHYTSLTAALADLTHVFAGDTLYIEPGHVETESVSIGKTIVIIGPGYMFPDNNLNMMDVNNAVFSRDISLSADGIKIYGCTIEGNITYGSSTRNNCVIERCRVLGSINTYISIGSIIRSCIIHGELHSGDRSSIVEGNIILGRVSGCDAGTFRNNTVIVDYYYDTYFDHNYIITGFTHSDIYNNIIINTNTRISTTTNPDQTIDTTFFGWAGLQYNATNNVHHNILSNNTEATFNNCVFNVKAEDVLVLGGNNEAAYMHKANGPAVGTGVSGSTCGAFGNYGGGTRPYSLSGIPYGRPYIYDAEIDQTPSSNNTINASFKIKVQNQ